MLQGSATIKLKSRNITKYNMHIINYEFASSQKGALVVNVSAYGVYT